MELVLKQTVPIQNKVAQTSLIDADLRSVLCFWIVYGICFSSVSYLLNEVGWGHFIYINQFYDPPPPPAWLQGKRAMGKLIQEHQSQSKHISLYIHTTTKANFHSERSFPPIGSRLSEKQRSGSIVYWIPVLSILYTLYRTLLKTVWISSVTYQRSLPVNYHCGCII